jgi:glycosyltransferase involved in cell wall biosynthesis
MKQRAHGAGVAVLLPVLDAAATLPTSLRSLQRQTDASWHCVVVDDGSRDESAAIVRAFADRDDRIELIRTPHRGIVSALNTGLTACRAPLVARLDADDWMHRDRLAAQRELLLQHPQLSGAGCRVRLFPRDTMRDGRRRYESWLNSIGDAASVRREAYIECPIAHPSLMVRREVLDLFGYRERGWPEDYDLLLRLLTAGHELAVHPRRLLSWRDSAGRLSRTAPEYGLDRFTACKAAFLAMDFLAGRTDYMLWGYGETGRALRRALLEEGKSPSHIVELHPRRIGQQIHGAPVIHPDVLRELAPTPLIVSVSGQEPRSLIRAELTRIGRIEGRDFVCAA